MVLREFPDLNWLKRQAETGFANRRALGGQTLPTAGWPSVIMNAKATNVYRDNIRGPLSIFTNLSGTSVVTTNEKRTLISEGFFYVTNQDQHYTLEINQSKQVETSNVHFGDYFADEVYSAIQKSPEKLLDEEKFTIPFERIELYNKLYPKNHSVNGLLYNLKTCEDSLTEEEKLYELFLELLKEDLKIKKIASEIPVLKNATRVEIAKRLITATDYIYSFYDKNISLEQLAEISCLSKFHFLRLFKIAFHKTPHHFINEVKIERAKNMLKHSKEEIQMIARSLGFQDASSFSRLFFQHTGVYPTYFRK